MSRPGSEYPNGVSGIVKGTYLDGASEYLATEFSGNQVPSVEECQVKKIARRTTGAKECYFLQDLYPLY